MADLFRSHVIGDCIIVPLLFCPIQIFFLWKIFSNLYEFKTCALRKHNWIIEPSKSNKILALLISLFIVITNILCTIIYIVYITDTMTFVTLSSFISIFSLPQYAASKYLYSFYLLSTLKYHMNHEQLIKNVISNKNIIFIQILILLTLIKDIVRNIIFYTIAPYPIYNGIPWLSLLGIIETMLQILIELSFIYLYIKGFNNIAHFWYSKCWKEYEKYGETDKTHEIFIIITRSTVMVIANTTVLVLFYLISFIGNLYFAVHPISQNTSFAVAMWKIQVFTTSFFIEIGSASTMMTVYFMYDFGYNDYRKICSKCHHKMYDYAKSRHQKQVKNGAFDGEIYAANNNKQKYTLFCCPSLVSKTEIQEEEEEMDEYEFLFGRTLSVELYHQIQITQNEMQQQ